MPPYSAYFLVFLLCCLSLLISFARVTSRLTDSQPSDYLEIMILHHRQDVDDIRFAYDRDRVEVDDEEFHHTASSSSHEHSTLNRPTECISHSPIQRHESFAGKVDRPSDGAENPVDAWQNLYESPRSSMESTTSSLQSDDENLEAVTVCEVPELSAPQREPHAIPATPADFSDLFPSGRSLDISHDDTTIDGNMNLRIDTHIESRGHSYDITLFHLRLHDLKSREFSLRRYCRDSGREVCRSTNKQCAPCNGKRPGLQRSLSSAFSRLRPQSDSRAPNLMSLKRHDSGYASLHSIHSHQSERPASMEQDAKPRPPTSANTIHLEFSNYAQVKLERNVSKSVKRYDFDYWGTAYTWKRIVKKDGTSKQVTYNLTKAGSDQAIARILPAKQDAMQREQERNMGGWIPQCYMRIVDEDIINGPGKDTADVVVATGLMAVVDTSIREHFRSKSRRQLMMPRLQVGVEYIGPKRLIRNVYRRMSSSSSRASQPSFSTRRSGSVDGPVPASPRKQMG